MLDKGLILRKLSELEEYLEQITEYKDISTEQYSGDWRTQRIVERTLQMMIETCVDIAGHIISDKRFRVPKTYADAFKVLAEEEILDKELSVRMERMAKFRNVVVHNYDEIDSGIVVSILRNHLDDFNEYKKSVVKLTQKQF